MAAVQQAYLVLLDEHLSTQESVAEIGRLGQPHLVLDPQFLVLQIAQELAVFLLLLQLATTFDQRRLHGLEPEWTERSTNQNESYSETSAN